MNGLTLRISKGGGKKPKNTISFAPLDISKHVDEQLGLKCAKLKQFSSSSSIDEQLATLKSILEEKDSTDEEEVIRFSVIVFFEAEAKHPVKCFIVRYITKTPTLHNIFSTLLSQLILSKVKQEHANYRSYIRTVSKLSGCIENFPAGARAMKLIELELCAYLNQCLSSCIKELRNTKQLSPTEKNEIFNLSHLCLRLQLHILQRMSQDTSNLSSTCNDLRFYINELLFDEDVPMDTKSVCGIVYLTIELLENGPNAWIDLLQPTQDDYLHHLLSIEASELSLYSAICTVVAVDRLQGQIIDGDSAILVVTRKILEIGERSSSDSIFTLGVTRTLLQISKTLDKLTEDVIGLTIIDLILIFVWSHLEHYMDSVRHLTAQILSLVVKYCAKLEKKGEAQALKTLFNALTTLDKSRKSYYVSLTALTVELGADVIFDTLPNTIDEVIEALSLQAVQASATTTLEILLQKHKETSNTETIYKMWIQPIMSYVSTKTLESGVLNVLENILAKAVKLDEGVVNYILPHIKQSTNTDLKCILMLLSVARKAGVGNVDNDDEWRGLISYDVLKMAAVSHVDETRILSLSLIVESPKTTEIFAKGDLDLVLYYLKYNINAQSPNFRQLTLSMMKKFTKRLEDSYKVLKRQTQSKAEYYTIFIEDLRKQCIESLIDGANYSRRFVALQVLVWCEQIYLDGYHKIWKPEYVEKLLLHLEDSYENNKSLALQILNTCPAELLQIDTYPMDLKIENIMQQASSLKPTDCVSAAYKLNLLKKKLPDYVLDNNKNDMPEAVTYSLILRLHKALLNELEICNKSIVIGAVRGPMYGLIHCMAALICAVDVLAISRNNNWSELVASLISTCIRVNDAVGSVVNNSSPEGHLPMDMSGVTVNDHGNSGGVRLEDGRQVTSQMVLLCAWRSVKEVSLFLGEISSRLTITGEGDLGTLTHQQMLQIGEHFTKLLAETKHRGAFEQAYVGFTKLLARLWRCRSPSLHELPKCWLSELMTAIATGDKKAVLCATRRSAGLPFMIQALVTTELQVQQNPKCFHECITTLLQLAKNNANNQPVPKDELTNTIDDKTKNCSDEGATEFTAHDEIVLENNVRNNRNIIKDKTDDVTNENGGNFIIEDDNVETRTHCINILRALFRNSALEESVAAYVEEGLLVALQGFEGSTWMERNSSTLLFSALMVRIFGVQRSKDSDTLCVRNRMTGRIFFLRYPKLYDFMLAKLEEVSSSADTYILRPSLYPILLLLARLYPSSLEGTVSNLKLVAYIPLVLSCARSAVLQTRQLAAKAMVPLISPEQYANHLEAMLNIIADKAIKRNYCHGILLQLIRLLDAKPETVSIDEQVKTRLQKCIGNTQWILQQGIGEYPCYLIVDEYVKVMNLVCYKLPSILDEHTISNILKYLETLIFNANDSKIPSGREVCLSHAFYLYVILLHTKKDLVNVCDVILKGLIHASYEVTLAVLNYILILNNQLEIDNSFFENLSLNSDENVLKMLRERKCYIEILCEVFKRSKYLECTQKSLKVLISERDTEKYIVEIKTSKKIEMSKEFLIEKLINYVRNEHENLTHVYLECLLNYVSKVLRNSNINKSILFDVIRVIFECSSSDNCDLTRSVLVKFLENNCDLLLNLPMDGELNDEYKFEYKATLFATMTRLLEDDDVTIRQCTSNLISRLSNIDSKVISTKSSELLADLIERDGGPMLCVMALLDFKSEVCLTDEVSDECRVFDQNERYNIFLEETIWTNSCAERIAKLNQSSNNLDFVVQVLDNNIYKNTFDKLCNTNVSLFKKIVMNNEISRSEIINPKVRLLYKILIS